MCPVFCLTILLCCVVCYAVDPSCRCVIYQSDDRGHGSFQSPNYPSPYSSNISCILYTFVGNIDHIIELEFLAFDLQPPEKGTSKCTDFLKFFLDVERPEVGDDDVYNYALCGGLANIQKKHYSKHRTLILEFHSGPAGSRNHAGFLGKFRFLKSRAFQTNGIRTAACKYVYKSDHAMVGKLFSDGYPQNYPPNAACEYKFIGKPEYRVRVNFLNVQLQNGCRDYLEAYDGYDDRAKSLGKICNIQNNVEVHSSTQDLRIIMRSDGSVQGQGFAAEYQFEWINPTEGAKPGGSIQGNQADGIGYNMPKEYDIVTYKTKPPSTTPSQSLISNPAECRQKFSSLDGKSGTFQSPYYPRNYERGRVCTYEFRAEPEERVQITFGKMELAVVGGILALGSSEGLACNKEDNIEITFFSAGLGEEEQTKIYCKNAKVPQLMSAGQRLQIVFRSTYDSATSKGFIARYKFVSDYGIKEGRPAKTKECKFNFQSTKAKRGVFYSPNYPGLYPRSTTCEYVFQGIEGEQVKISYSDFKLDPQHGCPVDLTDVIEYSNFAYRDRQLRPICGLTNNPTGRAVPPPIMSESNYFNVKFRTNSIYDNYGFNATYQFLKSKKETASRPQQSQFRKNDSSNLCSNLTLWVITIVAAIRTM